MHTRIFDRDPTSGTTEFFHYDPKTDDFTIETRQECDDLVEENRRAFNDAGGTWKGDMHRVASIPMNLYFELQKRGITQDPKKLRAWLNDPDNRYFRTRPGKV